MVAENPAQKDRRPAPEQLSEVTTYHLDLEPSDLDSQIIDLIEVIDDEISAKGDGPPGPTQWSETKLEETALFETLEGGKAFPLEASESNAALCPSMGPAGGVGAGETRREVSEHEPKREPTKQPEEELEEGAQVAQDLDTDQLLAEFFASEDLDLPERTGEKEPSADGSAEALPTVDAELFSKLLEDLESTERAVVQEAAAAQPHLSAEEAPPIPEIQELEWVRSGRYYPQFIASLDKQIAEYQQEMENKVSELKAQRDELKQNFEDVRSLLYLGEEDELRKAVIRVFAKFWKLKFSELDGTKRASFKEDLLLEHDGRKVVFKIKSTSARNPSLKFITQLWQELHYSGLGASSEGGLIVNHNVRVKPEDRDLAYTGNEEEHLEDIIFVDTRVLYNLTVAIIDYGLPVHEATELLLRKGRVKFHLDSVAT